MNFRRINILFCLSVLCFFVFAGCGKNSGPKINGVSLSKYQIVGETEDYGTKLAVEELSAGMKALTDGVEPKCEYGAEAAKNVIYIANSPSDVGRYSIKADGSQITISGPGINGRLLAVRELLSMLEGKEAIDIGSIEKAMFELPKSEKLIAEGEIAIGFIGDSVTTETEAAYDPWPYLLMETMKKEYPDTTFNTKNVALHGKTTAWGAENVGELLLESSHCDLVFIALGTNDSYYDVNEEQTKTNFISMVEQIYIKNPKAEIIFVLYGRDFELRGIEGKAEGKISGFTKQMLSLSDKYNIPIIEVMSAMYDACVDYAGEAKALDEGWKHYFIDDVHPFGHGQVLYHDVVWAQLKEALSEK